MALAYVLDRYLAKNGGRKPGSPDPFGLPPTSTGLARTPVPPPAYDSMAGLATNTGRVAAARRSPSGGVGHDPKATVRRPVSPPSRSGSPDGKSLLQSLGLLPKTPKPTPAPKPLDLQGIVEQARGPARPVRWNGVVWRNDPFEGLPFDRDAFDDGLRDPARGVTLRNGDNVRFDTARRMVTKRTGVGSFLNPDGNDMQGRRSDEHAVEQGVADDGRTRSKSNPHRGEPAGASLSRWTSNARQMPGTLNDLADEELRRVGVDPGTHPYAAAVGHALAGTLGFVPGLVGSVAEGLKDPQGALDHAPEGIADLLDSVNVLGPLLYPSAYTDEERSGAAQFGRGLSLVGTAYGARHGLSLAPEAARALQGLKSGGEWGWIAKAQTPELAAKAAQRRLGLSSEQARKAIRVVEASGERVWWRGKNRFGSDGVAEVGAGKGRPARRDEPLRTTKGLEAPNVPFEFGPLPEGIGGRTDLWGNITINEKLRGNPEAIAENLRHEAVHRDLAWHRRTGQKALIRQFLNNAGHGFYDRSELGRWLEEALAEGYAQGSFREGVKYPFEKNYVTKSGVVAEGAASAATLAALMAAGYRYGTSLTDYSNEDYDPDASFGPGAAPAKATSLADRARGSGGGRPRGLGGPSRQGAR